MKTKRTILYRVGAVVLLLIIAGIMMIIGRGHTVYIDNVAFDYNGQTYKPPYKTVVFVDDAQVAKLYDKERGMSICIGQKFKATLEVTKEQGGSTETIDMTLELPYSMDGVMINLPAYLAGLPQDVYLSEFIQQVAQEEEETPPTDEFGGDLVDMGDI